MLHRSGAPAARVQVRFDRGRHALRVRGEGIDAAVPARELSIAPGGWRGEAIHLTWSQEAGQASVSVDDGASFDVLERELPPHLAEEVRMHRVAARRAHRRSRVLLGCLLAVLLLPVAGAIALIVHPDPLLDLVVPVLPTAADEAIGDALEREVTARDDWDDPVVEDAVARLGARLVAAAPPSPFDFRFHVVADPAVNAFAAPGGVVVVHSGLLRTAESAEEVAGVLAHEIAHVTERHSLHQLAYRVGLWGTLGVLLGAGEGVAGTLADAAGQLSGLGFGRGQELEADRVGLQILLRAGISPQGMARFFERLAEEGDGTPALLSTHPASDERAARLRELIAQAEAVAGEPLDVDWAAVQGALPK